ncbi:LOW QUALITY PROTEIN: hypothetical protein Cgig2_025732 [Carnegiea gigantea]|uniref:Uncharacterized protein n=1 Tax=Carnegiea gigantea TaxID=171969 RepID=A0A9Q1GKF2_9CARY|nr:LOW QUALITY PROTEIN: hypothetical protein Cgig2_025732 [Carnegiea gigantea]
MSPSNLRHSAPAFTPRVKTSAMAISFLGGSEALGVTKPQDLTKSWTSESLVVGSALMKLVDGRWRPRPRLGDPRSVAVSGPVGLWQASSRMERGRVPNYEKESGDKQGYTLYLFGRLGDEALPLLFPPSLGIGRHLFRGGVLGLEDRQPCPRLICIKQKGSQDQEACCGEEEIVGKELQLGELIQRLPVAGLAPPPLGALHRLNHLSHKLGDGPKLIILAYVKLEVAGNLPLLGRGLPKGSGTSPQPDSQCKKRKSYFQYFTFDFFSMAKLDLLLKQYHHRSSVSLGAFFMACTRLNARAE